MDDIDDKTAELLPLLEQDPAFAKLPDGRQEELKAAWQNFLSTRLTTDAPNWGTLISLLLSSCSDDEAEIFSRALEKIS